MIPLRMNELLATVREDHELVAEQLRILDDLKETIAGAEGRRLERALAVLRSASRFFQTKLLPHFEAEERGMFLFFWNCLPKGSTLVYELEAEHEQMRRICERLSDELHWLRHAKHRTRPVLSDLQELCSRLAELLHQHAEQEERLIEQYTRATGAQQAEAEVATKETEVIEHSAEAHVTS